MDWVLEMGTSSQDTVLNPDITAKPLNFIRFLFEYINIRVKF